jgi:hypothetical protein
MKTSALKKVLHKKIDSIDDTAVLEAIYTLLDREERRASYSLSKSQVEELDRRLEAHDSGEIKYYSPAEAKKIVLGAR